MPASSPIDPTHQSNPAYLVVNNVSVAAAGNVTSEAVDVDAFSSALLLVMAAGGTTTVNVQVSLDEVAWFQLIQQVDTPGPALYTSGGGATNTARRIEVSGARYLRTIITNGSAAAYTVSAWIALQTNH